MESNYEVGTVVKLVHLHFLLSGLVQPAKLDTDKIREAF